ncbi:hypothetical protein GJ496_010604 [Pomphorhynchus laevis]|nr:hypothetical protein GJ496_010604 [Pomphorhynchus laevis]
MHFCFRYILHIFPILNDSFSEVNYEAEWTLQSFENVGILPYNSSDHPNSNNNQVYRIVSYVVGNRSQMVPIIGWSYLPVFLEVAVFSLVISLLLICYYRCASRISSKHNEIEVKTNLCKCKDKLCRQLKDKSRRMFSAGGLVNPNYRRITDCEKI